MEERIATCQENSGKFLIVICHHGGTRGFLCHGKQVVNIFNRTKRLLPQLKFNRGIELGKASVEVMLESVGIRKIDRMRLM